ncbi:MAG: ABC transporter permease [Pseudomonadota bacterium]
MTDATAGPGAPAEGRSDTAAAAAPARSAAPSAASSVEKSRNRSLWGDVLRQYLLHRGAMAGTVVFVSITVLCFLGPFIHTVDPGRLDPRIRNQGMTWDHPFGTDNLGRDMLAQVMAGGQVSIAVGIAAMLLSLLLGTLVGVLAGYFRRMDGPLMRLTDLFLALPLLPLLLVIILLFRDTLRATFGPEAGVFLLIVFVIGITSWMQTARIVRGDVLGLREREFVLAARSIGTRGHRIITRHIMPNVLSPIMVSATIGVANAIITESALSFLGLGFPPDFPTWGRLLFDGKDFMQLTPARVIWPGLAISLTVLSINFMGDGLRDALDPRLRGR